MFGFEKLDVWQRAIDYSNQIYSATSQYPSQEQFGLTNQTRRAAVSIAANIALKGVDVSRGRILVGSLKSRMAH